MISLAIGSHASLIGKGTDIMKWPGIKDLNQKWKGVPIFIWVAIAGGLLYFFATRNSGSSSANAANTAGTNTATPSTVYGNQQTMPGVVVSQNGTVLTRYNPKQTGSVHPANVGTKTSGGVA